jgi:hypothetical protein
MTQDITSALQEELLARPRSFWHCIQASRFEELRHKAQCAVWRNLVWDWEELCISNLARQTAQLLDFVPSEVFAHPQALVDEPELEEYYCVLACLSANKLTQIISAEGRQSPVARSKFLNVVVSARLEGMAIGIRQSHVYTALEEAGTEWQPTLEG